LDSSELPKLKLEVGGGARQSSASTNPTVSPSPTEQKQPRFKQVMHAMQLLQLHYNPLCVRWLSIYGSLA